MKPTPRDLMVARAVVGRNVANETDLTALIESLPEPDPPISFKVRRVPCACRNGCYKCGWRGSTLVHDTQPAEHEQAAQDAVTVAKALMVEVTDPDAEVVKIAQGILAAARTDGARAERGRCVHYLRSVSTIVASPDARCVLLDVACAIEENRFNRAAQDEHGGEGE